LPARLLRRDSAIEQFEDGRVALHIVDVREAGGSNIRPHSAGGNLLRLIEVARELISRG
jgi:hypothetical protein